MRESEVGTVGGTTGRLLYVDLEKREFKTGTIPTEYYLDFLGARGLAAKYYSMLIQPDTKPFDADNKLIFFTGPLTGTVIAGTKFSVATKSPETGRYICSNAGGNFGPYLKQNGFDGLIIIGESEQPVALFITPGGVEFREVPDLWTLTVSETIIEAKEMFGHGVSVMTIGPAGENLVTFSSIQADDRSFGRGGAGAVMGKKNLKLIAISRGEKIPIFDSEGLKAIIKEIAKKARAQKQGLVEFGTAQLTEVLNEVGAYPTRNFKTAEFEGADCIDAHAMKKHYFVRNTACFHCPIACGKLCTVKDGAYSGTTSDPEYETIWAFGAHCGISDFSVIIKANRLCDDLGMDTISAGYLAGVAMELSERNLVSREETGGKKLSFGSGESLITMLELIAYGNGLGELFRKGCLGIIRERPEWEELLVHVKGMPCTAYDPRGLKGMGLAMGTSSRGACHNVGGWTISDELGSGKYDRFALEGKGKLVKTLQDTRAYIDSLGVCTQVRKALGFSNNPEEVVLKLITGMDLTPDLMKIGERVFNLERLILVAEGVTRVHDQMPARMSMPLTTGQAQGQSLGPDDFDIMLNDYYKAREWDKQGVPTETVRNRLGLV